MVIYAGVRYGIVTAVSFAIIGWGLMWLVPVSYTHLTLPTRALV